MVQKDVMKGPKLLLLDAGQLIVEASGDSFSIPVCSCCFKLSCHSAYRKPNFTVFEWKCICFLLILNFSRLILLWNWTLDLNQNRTLKLVVHIPVFPTVKYRVSSTLLSLPVTFYNNKQNHSLDRAPALSACAEWCVTSSLPGRVQKVVCCSFISCTMYETICKNADGGTDWNHPKQSNIVVALYFVLHQCFDNRTQITVLLNLCCPKHTRRWSLC